MGTGIQLYDTLQRRLVQLPTSDGGRSLKLYVCGITPYDSGHMGHVFTFTVFDVLVRLAEWRGLAVRYVQNVTDVDDPLFERARRDGVDWQSLARSQERRLVQDMDAMGWRRPDVMPRVSGELDSIRAAAERLAEQGYAYRAEGALYFDVTRYPGYGELSRFSRRAMVRKLRADGLLDRGRPDGRRHSVDFALWRPSAPGEPAWPSSAGPGRPGWHIECTAMAMRHLGDQIDVHGGGRDLVFSHHESERAQSESLTGLSPFAGAWMHVGLVRYQGRKMSKSLGNLVVVPQVLERGIEPAALRLYTLSHRCRADWEFRWPALERFRTLVARLRELDLSRPASRPPVAFQTALEAGLDTPAALRVLRAAARAGDGPAAAAMLPLLAGTASLQPASKPSR